MNTRHAPAHDRLDPNPAPVDRYRRLLRFTDIDNARDLGGLPVASGGSIRRGVVFRSATPQQLGAADLRLLTGPLGLRTVIDLRTGAESEREGHGRLSGTLVRVVNLPLRVAGHAAANPAELAAHASAAGMVAHYRELLSGSGASVIAAMRLLARPERHSVLFHCAAGKDRTGLLAALLLDALGVSAEHIVADYALSAEHLNQVRARLITMTAYRSLPPLGTGIMSVDPGVMAAFLRGLHDSHGGAAGWLRLNGLSAAELDLLRLNLIDQSQR
ncbi:MULTISPECIES: tyrosine-protein phosphatase [unclassified Nocardia]|uniref:tyrosine-protein phosphatase n=1 Tax=unclassified Nocardia TaxID=2637762 RepID=UPI001CE3D6D4|nr:MULTISPECIES: tyrosine-protein phosphatase [unclassified Nocardia]